MRSSIIFQDFTLITDDCTFAVLDGDAPYGCTTGCHTPEEINMNLTGTGFAFAPYVR